MDQLIRCSMPTIENIIERYQFYRNLSSKLESDELSYIFEWTNAGNYYPDFVYLDPEHAIIFKLKYL